MPLIDVLVMLIFFAFVTMQFKSASTLNITLPKIATAGKNEFKGNVTIAIDKDGSVTFNGKVRHATSRWRAAHAGPERRQGHSRADQGRRGHPAQAPRLRLGLLPQGRPEQGEHPEQVRGAGSASGSP